MSLTSIAELCFVLQLSVDLSMKAATYLNSCSLVKSMMLSNYLFVESVKNMSIRKVTPDEL